jgi:hypothetical protein
MPSPPKNLLDRVRDAIRRKHYTYRTEQTYLPWIWQYVFPAFTRSTDPRSGRIDKVPIIPKNPDRLYRSPLLN